MRTFEDLVKLDPRLRLLERQCQQVRQSEKSELQRGIWWARTGKPQMEKLVGWHAQTPGLIAGDSYDVAYQHLAEVLWI